ncbi:MAG: selenoneine biosynthesis selenosugar synthase SenB [Actinomycetota bacterium]
MSRIAVVVPIRPTARSGNDVTAARWAGLLTELGHEVVTAPVIEAAEPDAATAAALADADALLVLHALRSAKVVEWWERRVPARPLIVALTGTDLYLDLPESPAARRSVEAADALIVLQRSAVDRLAGLDPSWAEKARVVHQSVDPALVPDRTPAPDELRVVVLAHLREVKDPLLAARAARLLPDSSRVVVHHVGAALDDGWRAAAETEAAENPRYRWHGELDHRAAMRMLATADVLACTSVEEGGANVVTEALAVGAPVIGTRMDGNTGLLGEDHPGLVPVGDHEALSELLARIEAEPELLAELQGRTDALRPITDPATERTALAEVVRLSGASA